MFLNYFCFAALLLEKNKYEKKFASASLQLKKIIENNIFV